MKAFRSLLIACTVQIVVGGALAQGAMGPGPGMGPRMQGAGPGASAPGMGRGMQAGHGPGAQAGAEFTPGWSFMTPAERDEHRTQMRSMKTYEECKAYVDKQHEQMAARAKDKGGKPLAQPRRDPCAGLKKP